MGYESKIYVVTPYSFPGADNHSDLLAEINMGKFPLLADVFCNAPVATAKIIVGDEYITEDKYGAPLRERSLKEVVTALEGFDEESKKYRRYPMLLGLLKSLDLKNWPDGIRVLHYGY